MEVLGRYRSHDFTLSDALKSRTQDLKKQTFIWFEAKETTWSNFSLQVNELSAWLLSHHIAPQDRVGIMARNHQAHVLLLFALAQIKAVMVPINPEFGVEETRYVLDHAQPRLVLVDEHSSESFIKARDCMHSSERPLAWSIETQSASAFSQQLPPFYPAFQSYLASLSPKVLEEQHERVQRLQVQTLGEDTCLIIYTSGTTGFPKGVMHSQRSFLLGGEAFVERMYLQHDDRLMIVLPFFHMNALFYSVAGGLAAGASIAIMPRFSASSFWHQAVQSNSSIVNLIDAACQILKKRPRQEYLPEHRLRAAYGVRHTAWPTFQEEFHIPHLVSGYGMTEIPGVTCSPFTGLQKPGTMGPVGKHPDPNREWASCRVVNEKGVDLGSHEVGELWVKTPIIMQGYFRDPEQTQKQFDNGWFKTGDVGRWGGPANGGNAPDDYLCIVGRSKDLIISGGYNVYPKEIESFIDDMDGVDESAVIGIPHPDFGEAVMAVVVAKAGAKLDAQAMINTLKTQIANFKVPKRLEIVSDLPRNAMGKVQKNVLREQYTQK